MRKEYGAAGQDSGEINTADLMTKHLVGPILIKHVKNLSLDIRDGRSEQAAKLHSLSTSSPAQSAEPAACRKPPGGDYWAERGEHGRWVRVCIKPRS